MTSANEDLEALKWRVWDQAWNQSRHLETMRSQYLGFFFTAVLAVTAIAAKDLADNGLSSTGAVVALAILGLVLDGLAAFLLLSVARMGGVVAHYTRQISAIQQEGTGDGPATRVAPWLDLAPKSRAATLGRVTSTQGAAEAVLVIGSWVFPVALLALTTRAITAGGLDASAPVAAGIATAAAGALCLGTTRTWRLVRYLPSAADSEAPQITSLGS